MRAKLTRGERLKIKASEIEACEGGRTSCFVAARAWEAWSNAWDATGTPETRTGHILALAKANARAARRAKIAELTGVTP